MPFRNGTQGDGKLGENDIPMFETDLAFALGDFDAERQTFPMQTQRAKAFVKTLAGALFALSRHQAAQFLQKQLAPFGRRQSPKSEAGQEKQAAGSR